ncbi:isovaleryl CoA dehydrogenase, partial [Salmonella enterica subsp. enterica serovar Heidelberg str. 640151-11]
GEFNAKPVQYAGEGAVKQMDVLRGLTKQHGVYDVLSEAFAEVKGQDRHYDRAVRQLQQRLRKPDEAMGREITQQLFLLGCGAEMLRHASPPLAQAWCQMMLDNWILSEAHMHLKEVVPLLRPAQRPRMIRFLVLFPALRGL